MKRTERNTGKSTNFYYLYGKHAVLSALENKNRKIKKVYCTEKIFNQHESIIKKFDKEIVEKEFFHKILGREDVHQGIVAVTKTVFLNSLEELAFSENKDRVAIVDQITDPQNIGSIIRSAAAFGINKIILPEDHCPEENATIAKAASGCLEIIQVARVVNLNNTIRKLKDKGFWIVGLDAKGNSDIDIVKSHNFPKLAIVIGSESKGMRRLTAESCDFTVAIPISKDVESLNAATAASIIFYSLRL